jgi:hypothetical protein
VTAFEGGHWEVIRFRDDPEGRASITIEHFYKEMKQCDGTHQGKAM